MMGCAPGSWTGLGVFFAFFFPATFGLFPIFFVFLDFYPPTTLLALRSDFFFFLFGRFFFFFQPLCAASVSSFTCWCGPPSSLHITLALVFVVRSHNTPCRYARGPNPACSTRSPAQLPPTLDPSISPKTSGSVMRLPLVVFVKGRHGRIFFSLAVRGWGWGRG